MSRNMFVYMTVAGLLISALLACGEQASESGQPPESDIDTVVVSVTDTLGLLVGDSCQVFGTITQASWGEDGYLYVLDGQLGRLAVFSGSLEFFRYIGRLGSGPGEFQYPQSFAFLADGRLAVCDWGARSVVFFDSELEFWGQYTGYYPSSPRYVVSGPGNTYVAMSMEIDDNSEVIEGNSYIARFGEGMEPEHVYDSWPLIVTVYGDVEDGPDVSIGRVDHDFDTDLYGTVYLAERDDSTYLVEVFFPDGTAGILIEKDWERVEKTEEEKEQEFYEETMTEDGASHVGRRTIQNIYPWHNAIGSVDVDSEGNIWVGLGFTEMPSFEVYSPSGDLMFVAVIPELDTIKGLEYCFRNGFLAYDRQPVDYPKVYILEYDTGLSVR